MPEFTYRGLTIGQLQKLSMDEFISLLPARQRRSLKRGLSIEKRVLLEKIRSAKKKQEEGRKVVVKTHIRDLIILPEMVGALLAVYNGKDFIEITITPEMIGRYIGEFVATTKIVKHGSPGLRATRSSMYVPLK
ncbi:MAG: 30S ribosomal protein S19 [Candidatus Methanomethylicia archaeon]